MFICVLSGLRFIGFIGFTGFIGFIGLRGFKGFRGCLGIVGFIRFVGTVGFIGFRVSGPGFRVRRTQLPGFRAFLAFGSRDFGFGATSGY